MIVNFRVNNFRSIKDEVELSFEASNIKSLDNSVIHANDIKDKKVSLLKTVSIFGPNASGKSNIIKALDFMKVLILSSNSFNKGDKLPYEPYKLDATYEEQASSFEVELLLGEITYVYGFSSNESVIAEEYLYYYPNGRKSIIFERNNYMKSADSNVEDYKFTIEKSRQELFASMTSANKLFLSVSTNLENKLTEPVFNWFKDKLVVHTTDNTSEWGNYTTHLVNKGKNKDKIISFLKGADFNINDIHTKEVDFENDNEFISQASKYIKEDALKILKSGSLFEVKTIKSGIDKNGNPSNVIFDMEDESDGTNKFFELAGPFINMLSSGNCLVYDELDTKLHPNLLVFLVMLFNKNKTNAQMLFTVHNTVVLDQKYLRRDQIYFTNRLGDGSTDLYSVYDFPDEKITSNINKRYLSGRYKAIPFIDEEYVLSAMMEALYG